MQVEAEMLLIRLEEEEIISIMMSSSSGIQTEKIAPSKQLLLLNRVPHLQDFHRVSCVMFSRNSSAIAVGADYCDVRSGGAAQVQGGAGGLAAGLG